MSFQAERIELQAFHRRRENQAAKKTRTVVLSLLHSQENIQQKKKHSPEYTLPLSSCCQEPAARKIAGSQQQTVYILSPEVGNQHLFQKSALPPLPSFFSLSGSLPSAATPSELLGFGFPSLIFIYRVFLLLTTPSTSNRWSIVDA